MSERDSIYESVTKILVKAEALLKERRVAYQNLIDIS